MLQNTPGFHPHHAQSAPMMITGIQEGTLEKRFASRKLATPDQMGTVQHVNKYANKSRRPRQRRFSESAQSIPPGHMSPFGTSLSPQQHEFGGSQNDERINHLRPLFQIPSMEAKKNGNELRKISSSPVKSPNVGEFNHRVSPTSRHYAGPKFTESPAASELPLPPMEWLASPTAAGKVKEETIFEQAAVQIANVRLRNLLTELQQSPKQIPVGIGA